MGHKADASEDEVSTAPRKRKRPKVTSSSSFDETLINKSRKLNSPTSYLPHKQKNGTGGRFKCPLCIVRFDCSDKLSKHLLDKHSMLFTGYTPDESRKMPSCLPLQQSDMPFNLQKAFNANASYLDSRATNYDQNKLLAARPPMTPFGQPDLSAVHFSLQLEYLNFFLRSINETKSKDQQEKLISNQQPKVELRNQMRLIKQEKVKEINVRSNDLGNNDKDDIDEDLPLDLSTKPKNL